ncbi:hypothetical protein [Streptomyces lydicus]|uniref:hypothetical protein n=1 Tax=Streptomyces lydicus TaxID=47763 RepID=UPI0010123523|nr:hypothetical protein [Streptomyces lydicus]MCZ1011923.1 hypothetical protein [Streptomyces lydicus]
MTDWPLIRQRDAELAYLAQYEQHGSTVPFGSHRTGYGWEPDHAVVLAVPGFAARHAAEHATAESGRIVLGPALPAAAAGPDERDVLALLRGAYPYLPTDAERDGADASPTPLMSKARAARRDSRHGLDEARSMERYDELVVGRYSWVPDDTPGGDAAAELGQLPVHWLKDWTLCLDVECGPRPNTSLHRLYGTVTSFESGTCRLGFSPTGGHPAIAVPLRRIVALTGDRQRRTTGQVPTHEPYDSHGAEY